MAGARGSSGRFPVEQQSLQAAGTFKRKAVFSSFSSTRLWQREDGGPRLRV
jgi:hypothetical protein